MEKNKKVYRNIVILCVALAFILVITAILQFVQLGVQTARNKTLLKEKQTLSKEVQSLNEEIEYKKSLPYIEKYVREQLDLFGSDDIVFVPTK